MGTLATPGTRRRRARIFQKAVIDMSIRSTSGCVEYSPIFITRLVDDRGWIMNGGADQVGRVGEIAAIRSATSCRAVNRSVPRSKMRRMSDSCSADLERISSRPGTPCSACSSGTVIRDSTCVGDSPMASVWISTRGGANSGNTSTGMSLARWKPKNIRPAVRATTMYRNFRLDPTSQRNTVRLPSRSRQCDPEISSSAP
jgi:hypothetical protein